MDKPNQTTPFPPDGWVTNREAARQLGVGLGALTCGGWKWRPMLREVGRCVRPPGGGRCSIYPVEGIERIVAAQAAWRERQVPEGQVDKEGACRMFGIELHTPKLWINEGKVRFGERVQGRSGAPTAAAGHVAAGVPLVRSQNW